MISGNNLKVQFGPETTYGTTATTTSQIKVASEGFKYVAEKKNEGLLTGGKSAGKTFTMSRKVEGAISTVAEPQNVGLFLGQITGVEATPTLVVGSTAVYNHVFTSIGTDEDDYLPAVTAKVDRVANKYSYSGLTLDTLSFSASPADFLKLDLKWVGFEEKDGAILASLTPSTMKSFRFAHGAVKLQGSTLADVTSVKFDYNNKLESFQTLDTGYAFNRAKPGAREITSDLEVLYSGGSDTIYNTLFKTDDVVALELKFTSEEEIETGYFPSITITIPNMQINECSSNISGAETVKQTMKLAAIEEGSDELITMTLRNMRATKYI